MGLKKRKISGKDILHIFHGTTVGTNALIERKLPKTALITTKGFRDVTEIRRGTKKTYGIPIKMLHHLILKDEIDLK